MRLYTFKTYLAGRPVHVRHLPAETDLEAMTKWCRLDSVQEMAQNDILQIVITSKELPDGTA